MRLVEGQDSRRESQECQGIRLQRDQAGPGRGRGRGTGPGQGSQGWPRPGLSGKEREPATVPVTRTVKIMYYIMYYNAPRWTECYLGLSAPVLRGRAGGVPAGGVGAGLPGGGAAPRAGGRARQTQVGGREAGREEGRGVGWACQRGGRGGRAPSGRLCRG